MSTDPDDVPEVFLETAEDFDKFLQRHAAELIAQHEKLAADTGQTQEFGFGIMQEGPIAPAAGHTVLEIRYICEPGKPARRVSVIRNDPLTLDTDD